MTLRHRLLLVNAIVVLLSVATVAVAVFELEHARRVSAALQLWNDLVLNAQKLHSSFPPERRPAPGVDDFLSTVQRGYISLSNATPYVDVDWQREALSAAKRSYQKWLEAPSDDAAEDVRRALDLYSKLTEEQLSSLKQEDAQQSVRRYVLLFVFGGLVFLHVAIVGSLLRRWLLLPMERLNRQVEALGRDQPPAEPLLDSPQEMARLAQALDQARTSLGSLRQQLIEAERLTTIGQLAAQLAHNLRNPLASIRAAAQVTLRAAGAEAPSRSRMEEIMASVDRMNQWIVGLMECARREPTPTRNQDVVPTLERVRDALLSELTAKELRLRLDVPPSLVCAHDPATLEHALYAMVVNAIEASPLGGEVVMQGEYVTDPGRGRLCRIGIADEGPGLPSDDPERIYDLSYSTKQRGIGLGLGLARLGLQRQGGSAHAVNRPGGGALVYVELPVASDDTAVPAFSEAGTTLA